MGMILAGYSSCALNIVTSKNCVKQTCNLNHGGGIAPMVITLVMAVMTANQMVVTNLVHCHLKLTCKAVKTMTAHNHCPALVMAVL